MAQEARRPGSLSWMLVSALVHALLVFAPAARGRNAKTREPPPRTVWVEADAPESEPEPAPEPPQPPPPPPAPRPAPRPRPTPPPPPPAAPEPVASPSPGRAEEPAAPAIATHAEGSVPVAATGAAGARDAGDGREANGPPHPPAPTAGPPPRGAGPPALSIWLAPPLLESMVLVQPVTGLLMALPGYSGALRGSGMRPFHNLRRLHVHLPGVSASGLRIAGVHEGGAAGVRAAAERVASMRGRAPVWREGDGLHATSWVDGSDADRALAAHDGAFLIAARARMPAILGDDGAASRVTGASRMGERVALIVRLRDVPRYLPELDGCGLQSLRLAFSGQRLTLAAGYRDPASALAGGACIGALPGGGDTLALLRGWLQRARPAGDGYGARLQTAVTRDDVAGLLDALGWSVRRATRN